MPGAQPTGSATPTGPPFLGLTGQITQAKDQRWVRTSLSHHRTRRLAHTGAICGPRGEHSYPASLPTRHHDPEGPGRRAGRAGEARAAAFLAARDQLRPKLALPLW